MNLILGFGETGASFVRFLETRGLPYLIMDSRLNPPGLSHFETLSEKDHFLGGFNKNVLNDIKRVLVSPGIDFNNEVLVRARKLGIQISTDIEIFIEQTNTRKILITGTNGKSTVVSMAGHLLQNIYGEDKVVCSGNIGKPVLDTISLGNSISIIELSSFNIEHSKLLSSDISVLLNIDQDHLDRHLSLEKYSQIKKAILKKTKRGLIGPGSFKSQLLKEENNYDIEALLKPFEKDLSSLINQDWPFHELINIKAAIAIYIAMEDLNGKLNLNNIKKIDESLIKESIYHFNSFKRMKHRYEIIGIRDGVTFINDSKSTNISSLEVALNSAQRQHGKKKVLLICGGDSKGQDFSKIPEKTLESIKHLFVFGKDKQIIMNELKNRTECSLTKDLQEAFNLAWSKSLKGEAILLSPACASTDMFSNYKQRGEEFRSLSGFN